MKVPAQGGEIQVEVITPPQLRRLNENPRPKAGKFARRGALLLRSGGTSMKVPTCRWRNLTETDKASKGHYPHVYYQSAIELVIPPLPCRALLANEQHAARE